MGGKALRERKRIMMMIFHLVTVKDGDRIDIPDDASSVTISLYTAKVAKIGYLLEEDPYGGDKEK